jgi:glutamyl-tRNA synthetase
MTVAAAIARNRLPVSTPLCDSETLKKAKSLSNAQLDDLIIARSDGTPTYNFAVIVDVFDDVLALSG